MVTKPDLGEREQGGNCIKCGVTMDPKDRNMDMCPRCVREILNG